MGAALLVCRLFLASVFVIAGVAKLADLSGSRRAVAAFGVPERVSTLVGSLLPVAEVTVGVALIPSFSARFGALAAAEPATRLPLHGHLPPPGPVLQPAGE
jgi:uncharacterized membrane protein YphA (DoxX/SURF4 family)